MEGMQDLVREAGEYGLEKEWEFSMDKTKKMVWGKKAGGEHENRTRLVIQGEEIEEVDCYEYLGVLLGNKENYLQKHEDKVRKRARQAGGMTRAVGRWEICRPEVMRRVWKGAMVPAVTYGQEVLCMGKEVELELDRVQREVGLRALGGTQLVAQEGLEGEWGCSSFKVREARAKLGYEGRLRYMSSERWAKKVYRYVGVLGIKTLWEQKVRRIGQWKGVDRRGVVLEEEKGWVRRERREADEQDRRERQERMGKKSSLKYYKGIVSEGKWTGIYTGSYGSDLLFRARTGSLETRRRMRWKGEGEECKLCGHESEDLAHVVLHCRALQQEREKRGWGSVTEEEGDMIRKRLGIGMEGEQDRSWVRKAEGFLVAWKKIGGGA
jgi:hypothetical protein